MNETANQNSGCETKGRTRASVQPKSVSRLAAEVKQMAERDEFDNAHFQTGIPMNGYECAHMECPTWRILTNPKGRVELYGTGDGIAGVAVLWDSLDAKPPNDTAIAVMNQLCDLRDAISLLLDAAATIET